MANYYVIWGIGYLPRKFETREKAEKCAKIAYYNGEPYKIVEGEEAFREEYLRAYEEFSGKNSSDVRAIKNDKKWNRFISSFRFAVEHFK